MAKAEGVRVAEEAVKIEAVRVAVGETVILLHTPLPLVGVSI